MRLTEKDKTFLENLKSLMESKDLWVELKPNRPSYMVLKRTYGEKIHKTFRMTRQGVKWSFHRLFNQAYIDAFSTILMIEKTFGTQLRENAIRISKQSYAMRQTELCQKFPEHVVCDWIGNSPPVAREHYLITMDEHFEQAIRPDGVTSEPAQNPMQQMHAESCNTSHLISQSAKYGEKRSFATQCNVQVGPVGFEPTTNGL
jgi:hypothetical protein